MSEARIISSYVVDEPKGTLTVVRNPAPATIAESYGTEETHADISRRMFRELTTAGVVR